MLKPTLVWMCHIFNIPLYHKLKNTDMETTTIITPYKTDEQVIKDYKLITNSQTAVEDLMKKFLETDKLIKQQDKRAWKQVIDQREQFTKAYIASSIVSGIQLSPLQYLCEFFKNKDEDDDVLSLSFMLPYEFRVLFAKHFMYKK